MHVSSASDREGFASVGDGVLGLEALGSWAGDPKLSRPAGVYFEIGDGAVSVEPDFFTAFPTLCELAVADTVRSLPMTEAVKKLFRRNHVLLRGRFDSLAETLAREMGLPFLHRDFVICREGDYSSRYGIDVITLRLRNGPCIRQSNFCQGSSAGNNGGGDVDVPLRKDFYRTCSPKDIAGLCWGSCYEEICRSAALAEFLKKAKQKNGYAFGG